MRSLTPRKRSVVLALMLGSVEAQLWVAVEYNRSIELRARREQLDRLIELSAERD